MKQLSTPLQKCIQDAFRARSKAISYSGGALTVRQCHDESSELEVWYRYEVGGAAYEVVLWVLHNWSALLEVRSRKRKEFGRLLFEAKADLSRIVSGQSGTTSLRVFSERILRLVDVFENIVDEVLVTTERDKLRSKLAAIWLTLEASSMTQK